MEEQGNADFQYWFNKSIEERLAAAIVMISVSFREPDFMKKKTDRAVFSAQYDVFTFRRPPFAIEILTELKGVEFPEAYRSSSIERIDEIDIRVIHINQLIQSKKPQGVIKT